MPTEKITISISESGKTVAALYDRPKKPVAIFVLAHGAGAGMAHAKMEELAQALVQRNIAVLRFQFCYMENKSRRPDRPEVAIAAIAAAVARASELAPELPLFAGGKSFGGRMTTQAAAAGAIAKVKKIVCFGFPLHPPAKPGTSRAMHLEKVRVPTLFIQGTRDKLSELTLVKSVVATFSRRLKLHLVDGADHSFTVLKSSGRTDAEVLTEVADAAVTFLLPIKGRNH